MFKRVAVTMAALWLAASSAWAGVVMKSESMIRGVRPEEVKTTLYLERNKMRMDTTDSRGKTETIIFRQDKQLFWVIDPAKGTYTEVTRAQLRQMKHQMDEYKRQMEEAMKNMPPQQRSMMEKMMKEQMPAAPKEPHVTYRKVGSSKVGRWYCTRYQGFSGGMKVEELCVASFGDVGITPADLKVLEEMGSFFDELTNGGGKSIVKDTKKWKETFKGFPVKSVSYENGRKVYEDRVVESRRTSLPQTLFELPRGLKRESMMPGAR